MEKQLEFQVSELKNQIKQVTDDNKFGLIAGINERLLETEQRLIAERRRVA